MSYKGKKHSVETRRKMSEAAKGRIFSAEHRRKLSVAAKGKKLSAETRRKLSEICKNISAETRRKMSENRKGNVAWNKGKLTSSETKRKQSISAIRRICNNPNKNPKFNNTVPERELKEIFTKNSIKFVHQYPMFVIKHQYAADFYLPDYNCIVEADGKYWHKYPHGKDIDHIRTKEMKDKGYTVLRFWEGQINEEDVMSKISQTLSYISHLNS